ncbi:MAG: VWA domain-containing protein [Candidatus Delongbacteria bacterium]|nr:VWA domain-containing protein [Candidatus Delongbacteria bacterium]
MKKIVTVFIISLILSIQADVSKMAVLNFSINNSTEDMNYLSNGISDILITNLAEKNNITIIEREKIQNLIEELNFKNSGLVTEKEQSKIGKLSGAKYILTGSITFVNSAYRMVSKVLDVETGDVISTQSVKGKGKDNIFDSADELSSKVYSDILGATNLPGSGPELEVAFIIDTTGSMGDEINVVKEKIIIMIDEILQGVPKPVVKFAVVDYKDRSDPYVTKIYDFKSDIKAIKDDINRLSASGGGDFPESVKEALFMGVNKLNWSKDNTKVGKLCFLIGDAEPHMDYKDDYKLNDIVKHAKDFSLSISSISCSGNSSKGVEYFQDIANQTNGTFSYLTYTQNVTDDKGEEYVVVTEGDHEVVLDEMIVESAEGERVSSSFKFMEDRAKKKADRARNEDKTVEQAKEDADDFMATAPSVSEEKARKIKSSSTNKGEKKNNLDKIMSEQIKVLAEKQGIKYDKPKPKKIKDKEISKEEIKKEEVKKDSVKKEVKILKR